MSMAEVDFFVEHRPGVTNIVPDALSRQPMSDLPVAEESYAPENGVISFLLIAMSVDVPHHTPTLVSETLNGTLAYLRPVCLLTHTQVHPPASMPVEPENFEEAAAETSSNEYLQVLVGLNFRRTEFATTGLLVQPCFQVLGFQW